LKNRCLQFKDFTFNAVFLNAVVYLKWGKSGYSKGGTICAKRKIRQQLRPIELSHSAEDKPNRWLESEG